MQLYKILGIENRMQKVAYIESQSQVSKPYVFKLGFKIEKQVFCEKMRKRSLFRTSGGPV